MIEKADYRLDFTGAIASLALLKLTRVFREMHSNQTLEVLGVDTDTRSDLFRVLPPAAFEVMAIDQREDASFRIQLKKR